MVQPLTEKLVDELSPFPSAFEDLERNVGSTQPLFKSYQQLSMQASCHSALKAAEIAQQEQFARDSLWLLSPTLSIIHKLHTLALLPIASDLYDYLCSLQ